MESMLRQYDRRLLPNRYLGEMVDKHGTGMSIGYPAWGLLYYSLLCSLHPGENLVIETGTNHGASTIVLAQALLDRGVQGRVYSFEQDPRVLAIAAKNLQAAGVAHMVTLIEGDSTKTLPQFADRDITFAFLDGGHSYDVISREVDLLTPGVIRARGKFYFDNTLAGGVDQFLCELRRKTGGVGITEFAACSIGPPGNAIYQPFQRMTQRRGPMMRVPPKSHGGVTHGQPHA